MSKQAHSQGSANISRLKVQAADQAPVEPALPGYPQPTPQPHLNMGRSLAQIVVVMLVLLMLVNIPFNNYRTGLAQLLPQSNSVVIREGLLLKGSGPEVYRVEDYKLRRIASPEIFTRYFNRNRIVTVEDSLIEQFAQGRPIRHLVVCRGSPTVYTLENGRKRWVKDLPPAASTKPWDKTVLVSCTLLRHLPDGLPISDSLESPPP